jgi:exosome complex component RRP41
MAGVEILSPEGFRLDGRRPGELRRLVCRMGVFSQADGSCYIEMGNTKTLAAVYGPHEVSNKTKARHDQALINCEFSMATFSTTERKTRAKGDRKSIEMSMAIRRTFESCILTSLYPRSQIDIFVQV